MWARYQVVPSCAAYQKTVPNAKKTVVAKPDRGETGSPPSIHQQSADVDRGEDREDRLVVRGEAPDAPRTAASTSAGSGGNGRSAARDAVGRRRPAGRPGSSRSRRRRRARRPGSGSQPGPRGTPRPATRSGCSSGRRAVDDVDRERGQDQDEADRDGEPASRVREPGRAASRAPRGPSGDPVLRSDPPSTLVQEPFPVTGPASGGTERGTASAVAGDRDAGSRRRGPRGARARARPPAHHRIPPARLRLRRRPRARSGSGRTTSPTNGPCGLLRPRLLPRLHPRLPVRPVARRRSSGTLLGGIGDLIKIPPILADLAIGYLVWSMVRELGGARPAGARSRRGRGVFNPIIWFDSVVWGQVDSFGVVFLLLAPARAVARPARSAPRSSRSSRRSSSRSSASSSRSSPSSRSGGRCGRPAGRATATRRREPADAAGADPDHRLSPGFVTAVVLRPAVRPVGHLARRRTRRSSTPGSSPGRAARPAATRT